MNTMLVGMLATCVVILALTHMATRPQPSLVNIGSVLRAAPRQAKDVPVSYMSATEGGSYVPESWLSAALGLDKHPATLAAINNTLRTVATDAGVPTSVVGAPDATATNPGGTGGTVVASPASLLSIIEQEGISVGVPALKTIISELTAKIPDLSAADITALNAFLDTLVDNVVDGAVKAAPAA